MRRNPQQATNTITQAKILKKNISNILRKGSQRNSKLRINVLIQT